MVVHHDRWTRSILLEALHAAGFTVEEASNGMTALRRALVTTPHIVALESKLPELSGPELMFELRDDPRTRRVAIVGVQDVVGSDASLDLPCTPMSVLSTVVQALEVRRQALATTAPIRSVIASHLGKWPLVETDSSRSSSRTRNAGRSLSSGIDTL
jgi:CheY-like chemotaxis protein